MLLADRRATARTAMGCTTRSTATRSRSHAAPVVNSGGGRAVVLPGARAGRVPHTPTYSVDFKLTPQHARNHAGHRRHGWRPLPGPPGRSPDPRLRPRVPRD